MSEEKIKVLVVNGIGDTGSVDIIRANSIGNFRYNTRGSCNIAGYLPSDTIKIKYFIVDHHRNQEINVGHILEHDVVFCELSDPDSHSVALRKVQHMFNIVQGKVPWINNPHLVLKTRRNIVSQLLSNIEGVIAPKAVIQKPATIDQINSAIDNNNLSLPLLIRPSGSHMGKGLVLIESLGELETVEFSNIKEVFITEYADYQCNGIFTKYRIAVVAGEPVLRHVIFSDHWVIHSESRKFMAENPEYQDAEVEIIENFERDLKPRIAGIIEEIVKAVKLDYFGIDCAIRDEQLIIFEVNATMNMLSNNQPRPNIWEKQIDTILQKLVDNLIVAGAKEGAAHKLTAQSGLTTGFE